MARRDDNDNDLSGLIYKNPDHQGNRPDMKGMVTVNGRLYWISGWTKETKRGSKLYDKGIDEFISLSLEPADDAQDRNRGSGRGRDRDDDRGARRDDRGSDRGRDDRGRGRDDDRASRDRDDRGSQDRGDSGRSASKSGFDDMDDDIPF